MKLVGLKELLSLALAGLSFLSIAFFSFLELQLGLDAVQFNKLAESRDFKIRLLLTNENLHRRDVDSAIQRLTYSARVDGQNRNNT